MTRLLCFMHTTSPIGGVETWLDRANEHLSRNGFDMVVGLVRGQKFNQPGRYREYHPQLETVEVDGRGMDREGRVRASMRCIEKLRPDIVLPLGIVDANEAVVRRKLAGDEVRLLGRAQGNLEPMLADLRTYRDWMDRVICPGRLTRRVLIEWAGFPSARVLNISNGADEPIAERAARPGQGPLRIGYVGRLSQVDKRALDLVPLCRELARLGVDFELDVAGDGPCGEQLRTELAEWGARVRMHGAIPHEEIYRRIYPALDVLVMTSASEAFGIVLVEALMHGVVPVSSRYDGFHSEKLVVEGQTGLSFEVGDMAAAAAAMHRLHDDPSLLETLSLAAQEHGRGYTWHNSLQRWQAALESLAAEPVLRAERLPSVPGGPASGRLERWGVPPGLVDLLRRMRRATLGPAVMPGGEEWPLFHRSHSPELLAEIGRAIDSLETSGASQSPGC
jgi:glycosyltransferase involved in cell wall biosynthesis